MSRSCENSQWFLFSTEMWKCKNLESPIEITEVGSDNKGTPLWWSNISTTPLRRRLTFNKAPLGFPPKDRLARDRDVTITANHSKGKLLLWGKTILSYSGWSTQTATQRGRAKDVSQARPTTKQKQQRDRDATTTANHSKGKLLLWGKTILSYSGWSTQTATQRGRAKDVSQETITKKTHTHTQVRDRDITMTAKGEEAVKERGFFPPTHFSRLSLPPSLFAAYVLTQSGSPTDCA